LCVVMNSMNTEKTDNDLLEKAIDWLGEMKDTRRWWYDDVMYEIFGRVNQWIAGEIDDGVKDKAPIRDVLRHIMEDRFSEKGKKIAHKGIIDAHKFYLKEEERRNERWAEYRRIKNQ
jgi:hypothetical protein